MNDVFELMEEDFEKSISSVEKLDNAGLSTVAGLARKIKQQQENVEKLDRDLKDAKNALLNIPRVASVSGAALTTTSARSANLTASCAQISGGRYVLKIQHSSPPTLYLSEVYNGASDLV